MRHKTSYEHRVRERDGGSDLPGRPSTLRPPTARDIEQHPERFADRAERQKLIASTARKLGQGLREEAPYEALNRLADKRFRIPPELDGDAVAIVKWLRARALDIACGRVNSKRAPSALKAVIELRDEITGRLTETRNVNVTGSFSFASMVADAGKKSRPVLGQLPAGPAPTVVESTVVESTAVDISEPEPDKERKPG